MCLPRFCCGADLDETFAYETIKTVTIKDRTLGLLKITLMLVIFAYVVVNVLFINKEYNIFEVR